MRNFETRPIITAPNVQGENRKWGQRPVDGWGESQVTLMAKWQPLQDRVEAG
jgi:hypothetical protein